MLQLPQPESQQQQQQQQQSTEIQQQLDVANTVTTNPIQPALQINNYLPTVPPIEPIFEWQNRNDPLPPEIGGSSILESSNQRPQITASQQNENLPPLDIAFAPNRDIVSYINPYEIPTLEDMLKGVRSQLSVIRQRRENDQYLNQQLRPFTASGAIYDVYNVQVGEGNRLPIGVNSNSIASRLKRSIKGIRGLSDNQQIIRKSHTIMNKLLALHPSLQDIKELSDMIDPNSFGLGPEDLLLTDPILDDYNTSQLRYVRYLTARNEILNKIDKIIYESRGSVTDVPEGYFTRLRNLQSKLQYLKNKIVFIVTEYKKSYDERISYLQEELRRVENIINNQTSPDTVLKLFTKKVHPLTLAEYKLQRFRLKAKITTLAKLKQVDKWKNMIAEQSQILLDQTLKKSRFASKLYNHYKDALLADDVTQTVNKQLNINIKGAQVNIFSKYQNTIAQEEELKKINTSFDIAQQRFENLQDQYYAMIEHSYLHEDFAKQYTNQQFLHVHATNFLSEFKQSQKEARSGVARLELLERTKNIFRGVFANKIFNRALASMPQVLQTLGADNIDLDMLDQDTFNIFAQLYKQHHMQKLPKEQQGTEVVWMDLDKVLEEARNLETLVHLYNLVIANERMAENRFYDKLKVFTEAARVNFDRSHHMSLVQVMSIDNIFKYYSPLSEEYQTKMIRSRQYKEMLQKERLISLYEKLKGNKFSENLDKIMAVLDKAAGTIEGKIDLRDRNTLGGLFYRNIGIKIVKDTETAVQKAFREVQTKKLRKAKEKYTNATKDIKRLKNALFYMPVPGAEYKPGLINELFEVDNPIKDKYSDASKTEMMNNIKAFANMYRKLHDFATMYNNEKNYSTMINMDLFDKQILNIEEDVAQADTIKEFQDWFLILYSYNNFMTHDAFAHFDPLAFTRGFIFSNDDFSRWSDIPQQLRFAKLVQLAKELQKLLVKVKYIINQKVEQQAWRLPGRSAQLLTQAEFLKLGKRVRREEARQILDFDDTQMLIDGTSLKELLGMILWGNNFYFSLMLTLEVDLKRLNRNFGQLTNSREDENMLMTSAEQMVQILDTPELRQHANEAVRGMIGVLVEYDKFITNFNHYNEVFLEKVGRQTAVQRMTDIMGYNLQRVDGMNISKNISGMKF